MTKISLARSRINAKRKNVCETYQRAHDAGDSIEVTIDELAKKHRCTRDSIRKIITMYRAGEISV